MNIAFTVMILTTPAMVAKFCAPPPCDVLTKFCAPPPNAVAGSVTATETLEGKRDKNGTSGRKNGSRDSQILEESRVTNRGSLNTERMGFEPMVEFPPHSISSAAPSAARSPLRLRFLQRFLTFAFPSISY